MKVGIYGGEAFPVYTVSSQWSTQIEIDIETVKRWRDAFAAFSKSQEEIILELRKQGHADQVWDGDEWYGFNLEINE